MGRRGFRKFSHSRHEHTEGKHRFEHWYRDNTVYFITSKVRDGSHAFASDDAKRVFWDRFDYWTNHFEFVPWVTTLMVNHYHTVGYLKVGEDLGTMMQRIHGSIAKLVNGTLPARHLPFWRGDGVKDYFDGCLRDQVQCRRAYRYTLTQSVRHGICADYRLYPDTHLKIPLEVGIKRALELNAFMTGVPYERYDKRRGGAR
jgi:hypothetical protein